jgi:hypothetical protein
LQSLSAEYSIIAALVRRVFHHCSLPVPSIPSLRHLNSLPSLLRGLISFVMQLRFETIEAHSDKFLVDEFALST